MREHTGFSKFNLRSITSDNDCDGCDGVMIGHYKIDKSCECENRVLAIMLMIFTRLSA
jgi:hypothetical protein